MAMGTADDPRFKVSGDHHFLCICNLCEQKINLKLRWDREWKQISFLNLVTIY